MARLDELGSKKSRQPRTGLITLNPKKKVKTPFDPNRKPPARQGELGLTNTPDTVGNQSPLLGAAPTQVGNSEDNNPNSEKKRREREASQVGSRRRTGRRTLLGG